MNRYYPHTIIAQEGWSFILGGLAASIFFSFLWGWWSLPFWIFTLFCVNFFRDPARNIPEAPDAIISPADGRIVVVERARDPYRDTEALKISVFMNVFDVHSQRSPVSGVVTDVKYTAGKFLNASLDKSSTENERNAVLMTTRTGREITFVQVAGLIARRVLCYVNKGDNMVRGERYGFIRFGSRVDVYLPLDATVNVAIGDRVRASETILAYLPLEASEPMPHQDLVNPSSQSVAENRLKADIQAAPFVETPFQAASQFAPVHESSLLDEARLAAATEHLKAETEAAKQAAEQARAQAELEIAKLKAEAEQARAQAEQAKAQAEAEVARLKAEAEAVQLKAQQEAQAASQAKAEAQAAKLKAEQEAQAAVQAKAQAEAAQLKAQQEAQAAQLKAQQEAQAAAQAKAQAEAEAQAAKLKAEQEAQAVEQAKAQAEAAQLKAQQEAAQAAQLKAQQEAQAKAQAEAEAQAAKLKAEQEAQAKAQQAAEAKARAEAVAKAQAAEKAKEEALAKAKADAEAKLKAEQAAKLKAEQEAKARAKAEQEAKAKAEQEALAEIAARKPIVRREVFAAVPEPWQTIEPREVIIRTEVVDKK